jgi:hypothetical protein
VDDPHESTFRTLALAPESSVLSAYGFLSFKPGGSSEGLTGSQRQASLRSAFGRQAEELLGKEVMCDGRHTEN